MGILSKLSVINQMFALIGEMPRNTLEDQHPLVTTGVNHIDVANARVQGGGWWFNTERATLPPDSNGNIIVSADILKLDPRQTDLAYTIRGNKLYNTRPGTENPYKFSLPVEVTLVRLIPFEDLPFPAQDLVATEAKLDFLVGLDGDAEKISALQRQRNDATISMRAEHIRALDVNLINRPSTLATLQSLRGAAGSRLKIR